MEEKSDLEKVELGIITKPFGIKGEIVIMPFSKEPIHLVNAKKVWIEENIYDVDNEHDCEYQYQFFLFEFFQNLCVHETMDLFLHEVIEKQHVRDVQEL